MSNIPSSFCLSTCACWIHSALTALTWHEQGEEGAEKWFRWPLMMWWYFGLFFFIKYCCVHTTLMDLIFQLFQFRWVCTLSSSACASIFWIQYKNVKNFYYTTTFNLAEVTSLEEVVEAYQDEYCRILFSCSTNSSHCECRAQ